MFEKKLKKSDFESISLLLKNDTIRNVAKILKVSPRTLQRYLKANGGCELYGKGYNPNPRVELNFDEIHRLRQEKMSFRRIAKRYNVCAATIYNVLLRNAQNNELASTLLYDYFYSGPK